MYNCALILAAGQGTRIKSDLPKVLHKVCGKEMVNHVIDTLRKAEINDINLIIGKGADLVKIKTENRESIIFITRRSTRNRTCSEMCYRFLKG